MYPLAIFTLPLQKMEDNTPVCDINTNACSL